MELRLSSNQLDVVKEVCTIGSASAATALSDLLAARVDINVPEVNLVPLESIYTLLGRTDMLFFVLDTELKGDLSGRIFLLFSPDDARFLASGLLGKNKDEIDFSDPMFQSALKEATNILSASYITALAEMTNLTIVTSVPSLAIDMVGAILDFIFIQIAQFSERALFIKTELKVKGLNLEALFLFFPSEESLTKIFEILAVKE